MQKWLSAVCLILVTLPALAGPDSFLIVPERGVGPFHPGMTKLQVQKLVKPAELGEADEGGKAALTVYFLDPAKRISLRLDERGKVCALTLHGDRSVWHDSHGITLGTPLLMLQKLNGKPIRVRGFDGSARSGQLLDWGGGVLQGSLARVKFTFASPMRVAGYNQLTEAQKLEVETGRDFLSTDAALQKLNPVVETIELTF